MDQMNNKKDGDASEFFNKVVTEKSLEVEKQKLVIEELKNKFQKAKDEKDDAVQEAKNQQDNLAQKAKEEAEANARMKALEKELDAEEGLKQNQAKAQSLVRQFTEERNQLVQGVQNQGRLVSFVQFNYNTPPNFDTSQVFGRIGKLFKVRDIEKHGRAIQTILGANLLSCVVVASANDATALLKHKAFPGFVKYLALDNVSAKQVD